MLIVADPHRDSCGTGTIAAVIDGRRQRRRIARLAGRAAPPRAGPSVLR